MLALDLMMERCKYCGKKKLVQGSKSEWKCPTCGKKNEKKMSSPFLA